MCDPVFSTVLGRLPQCITASIPEVSAQRRLPSTELVTAKGPQGLEDTLLIHMHQACCSNLKHPREVLQQAPQLPSLLFPTTQGSWSFIHAGILLQCFSDHKSTLTSKGLLEVERKLIVVVIVQEANLSCPSFLPCSFQMDCKFHVRKRFTQMPT